MITVQKKMEQIGESRWGQDLRLNPERHPEQLWYPICSGLLTTACLTDDHEHKLYSPEGFYPPDEQTSYRYLMLLFNIIQYVLGDVQYVLELVQTVYIDCLYR